VKKVFIFSLVILTLLLSTSPVFAWHRGHHHSGVFIGPPFFFFAPPPIYIAPPPFYYLPPPYYYDGYYSRDYRVWVPGYWDYRRAPYGWERAWIPGHWEYRD
jgi:hypothetical protein